MLWSIMYQYLKYKQQHLYWEKRKGGKTNHPVEWGRSWASTQELLLWMLCPKSRARSLEVWHFQEMGTWVPQQKTSRSPWWAGQEQEDLLMSERIVWICAAGENQQKPGPCGILTIHQYSLSDWGGWVWEFSCYGRCQGEAYTEPCNLKTKSMKI